MTAAPASSSFPKNATCSVRPRLDRVTDPLEQFRQWRAEAGDDDRMALATAAPDGAPSVRMVLLKGAAEDGFLFFTGYGSRKGRELEANPRAALLFYWDALGRQVRVEGSIERVSAAESDAYFATRPRGSQIAAAVSRQGRVLASREELDDAVAELERAGGDVARPDHWGGYRLRPDTYEFWQHRENRLHDRLRYRRDGDGAWIVERLSP